MGYKTGRPPLTNEYLLKRLMEASEKFGPDFSIRELKTLPRPPSKRVFQTHFGGFNKAKIILNLVPNGNKSDTPHRRHRKADRVRTAPLKERFQIFIRDGFRCVYCGRSPQDGAKLVVDHKTPFSNGGLTNHENMVTSCNECNAGKRDIILESLNK